MRLVCRALSRVAPDQDSDRAVGIKIAEARPLPVARLA